MKHLNPVLNILHPHDCTLIFTVCAVTLIPQKGNLNLAVLHVLVIYFQNHDWFIKI